MTLASNFSVLIGDQPLSCARVATIEMAADPDALVRKDHPGPPAQVRWSAPPLHSRLVLARAIDGDRTLYDWRHEAMHGKSAIRHIVIEHLVRAGGDVLYRFELSHCWPVRWTGPTYDAFTGEIAFEELEVVYADLHWS